MIKNNSFPEVAIQQICLEQDFDQVTLKTICGQQVKIEFAGWYNSIRGLDFREARLKIGKKKSYDGKLLRKQSYYFLLRIGEFGGNALFWVKSKQIIPHNFLEKTDKL